MDPNNPNQQQQYNPYTQPNPGFGVQLPPVPNATAIMVLGICSIVLCTLGPILGTIALILAKNAKAEFESKPGAYDPGSFGSVKTGRICGLIGLIVGILSWIFFICYFIFVFWMIEEVSSHGRLYGAL
jgi:hypothetical protein